MRDLRGDRADGQPAPGRDPDVHEQIVILQQGCRSVDDVEHRSVGTVDDLGAERRVEREVDHAIALDDRPHLRLHGRPSTTGR